MLMYGFTVQCIRWLGGVLSWLFGSCNCTMQVFASCSVDQTVRIWDCRAKPDKACMLNTHAHNTDVNVISWNRSEPLLISGGDDGCLKIWDLRQFSKYITLAQSVPLNNSLYLKLCGPGEGQLHYSSIIQLQ